MILPAVIRSGPARFKLWLHAALPFLSPEFNTIQHLEIGLALLGFAFEYARPVGSNQDVVWLAGPDPLGRLPAERSPNVVLGLSPTCRQHNLASGTS